MLGHPNRCTDRPPCLSLNSLTLVSFTAVLGYMISICCYSEHLFAQVVANYYYESIVETAVNHSMLTVCCWHIMATFLQYYVYSTIECLRFKL